MPRIARARRQPGAFGFAVHYGEADLDLCCKESLMPFGPAPILLIAREPLLPGGEDAYRDIEEELARLSVKLGCPNPYLAMESLTEPKEIWWFNGFESEEELRRIGEAYEKNEPFLAALKNNSLRKAPVTGKITEVFVHHRPDLSSGDAWILGHARYLAIAVGKEPLFRGTAYQAADETLYVFSPAESREQAERVATTLPGSTIVLARPSFSFPAKDWIDADPEFWGAAR